MKKSIPTTKQPARLDRFADSVGVASAPVTSVDASAITFRKPGKGSIVGSKRRCTVYLELELARRLADRCASTGLDMSAAVNTALRAWLATG